MMVRKRNGRLEVFSASKLTSGVSAALADRPMTGSDVQELVNLIEETIRSDGSPVTSERIGQEVLERLRAIDEVAYLRFASVYKEFQDAADFEREMAELESAD